jgi:hypothetical protein
MLLYFDVSRDANFIEMRSLLSKSRGELILSGVPFRSQGELLRNNLTLMLMQENLLKSLFISIGLPRLGRSLQFPMNVRVMSEAPPDASHSYDTRYIHSDIWSGAPVDLTNFLLYIDYEIGAPYVDFFDVEREKAQYVKSFQGSYQQAQEYFRFLKVQLPEPKPGLLVIFSGDIPHATHYTGGSHVRFSIDGRIREECPYLENSKPVAKSKFLDYIPGNPGWGYYWSQDYSHRHFSGLAEKIEFELATASEVGEWALKLREDYLSLVFHGDDFSLRRSSR